MKKRKFKTWSVLVRGRNDLGRLPLVRTGRSDRLDRFFREQNTIASRCTVESVNAYISSTGVVDVWETRV